MKKCFALRYGCVEVGDLFDEATPLSAAESAQLSNCGGRLLLKEFQNPLAIPCPCAACLFRGEGASVALRRCIYVLGWIQVRLPTPMVHGPYGIVVFAAEPTIRDAHATKDSTTNILSPTKGCSSGDERNRARTDEAALHCHRSGAGLRENDSSRARVEPPLSGEARTSRSKAWEAQWRPYELLDIDFSS